VENRRFYKVRSHYLLEIDKVQSFGSNGTMTETFYWDVYISSNDQDEYKGKATCQGKRHLDIQWTTLSKLNLDEEMAEICERQMEAMT
jgi:uncharacterized protein YrrD